jgi:ABC-type phosphate/phosphonate transport system substrate-binding protein
VGADQPPALPESIASLPMYDRPETAMANDALWTAIRARLPLDTPRILTRDGDPWDHWRAPGLILSQTCGCPYRTQLHGAVHLVGTPDHALPGCPPGHYNSVLIARRDDPRSALCDFASARFAFNEPLSQSGWAAPQTHAAGLGFAFDVPVQTGGHRVSARAVANGRADIAAIDALTWALIQRHDAFAQDLRELARTAPTPGLPLITALVRDPDQIASATAAAIDALDPAHRATLMLRGLVRIPAEAYLAVPTPAGPQNAPQLG